MSKALGGVVSEWCRNLGGTHGTGWWPEIIGFPLVLQLFDHLAHQGWPRDPKSTPRHRKDLPKVPRRAPRDSERTPWDLHKTP